MRRILITLTGIWFVLQACTPATTDSRQANPTSEKQYYMEKHRPQFHFSPEIMWMNDPNGMVYLDGEYHLFYQFYPEDKVWGPMHWGHAVSTDLVRWEHLPIALYPDSLGLIFSGSAVIDWKNTSGFRTGEEKVMVAIYTYHLMEGEKAGRDDFQYQGIAFSNDKGRTWTKYEGNPVIPNPGIKDFRDPKVFWHEPTSQWIMIFACGDRVRIYQSPDLKEWKLASEFGEDQGWHGGVWECPDLFPLPVRENGEEKWAMIVSLGDGAPNGGSGTMYFIGDFDGTHFTNSNPKDKVLWLDYGRDNYAGVTWSDIPETDGRRIFIGWMSNWQYARDVPTDPWRSAMTVPRVLTLRETPEGVRLLNYPVKEVETLQLQPGKTPDFQLEGDHVGDLDLSGTLPLGDFAYQVEWEATAPPTEFGWRFTNAKGESLNIGIRPGEGKVFVDRTASGNMDFSDKFSSKDEAPIFGTSPSVSVRIILDVSSVEVFINEGETVITDLFFPTEPLSKAQFYTQGGRVSVSNGTKTKVDRIWE